MTARTPPVVTVGAPDVVDRVVAALEGGHLVVLPTDTVYGVAARAGDRDGTDRLFALKGRSVHTPIAVLCADADQALRLTDPPSRARLALVAARFWPGALTLVLPRRAGLVLHLGEPETTVGVRVPAHDVVRAVAAGVGPLATTSANRHGEPTPPTALEAAARLGGRVGLVVDGGPLDNPGSTVIDTTGSTWIVLRHGGVPSADVLALAGG
ncbi:MAG: L-threonylcarbamoyladenylate synthase [Acidimicrobiales bacterium]